jgi:hypothetical protein
MKTTLTKISGFRAVALGTMLASGLIFNTLAHAVEEAVTQVQIPATNAAIWRSIDKETELLDALIQAGKFEEVHHRAFAIPARYHLTNWRRSKQTYSLSPLWHNDWMPPATPRIRSARNRTSKNCRRY